MTRNENFDQVETSTIIDGDDGATYDVGDDLATGAASDFMKTQNESIVCYTPQGDTKYVYDIANYADIADALQSAIDAATGPTVYQLPPGEWSVADANLPVSWNASDWIRGAGQWTTRIDMTGNSKFLFREDSTSSFMYEWAITDLGIYGDRTAGSGAIYSRDNVRYEISRIQAEELEWGLDLRGAWMGLFIRNRIDGIDKTGLVLDGDEIRILGGEYRECEEYNIWLEQGSGVYVKATINDGGYAGLLLEDPKAVTVESCFFESNGDRTPNRPVAIAVGPDGESAWKGGSPTGVRIVGNHFYPDEGSNSSAILLGDGSDIIIEGNNAYGNNTSNNADLIEIWNNIEHVRIGHNHPRYNFAAGDGGMITGHPTRSADLSEAINQINGGQWSTNIFHNAKPFWDMYNFFNDHNPGGFRNIEVVVEQDGDSSNFGSAVPILDGTVFPDGTTFRGRGMPKLTQSQASQCIFLDDNQTAHGFRLETNSNGGDCIEVRGDDTRVSGCKFDASLGAAINLAFVTRALIDDNDFNGIEFYVPDADNANISILGNQRMSNVTDGGTQSNLKGALNWPAL